MVPCRRYGKGDRVNASKSTCVSSPIFGDRQGSPAVAPMVPQVAALIGPADDGIAAYSLLYDP